MAKPKNVTIRDLLSPAQSRHVIKIVNTTPSTMERIEKLKQYFRSIEDDINKKSVSKFGNTGVNPDWLAYMVEHAVTEQTRSAQPNN